MREDGARGWIAQRYGNRATEKLDAFVTMIRDESTRQNLVAASTLPLLWQRHILDSAQLLPFAHHHAGPWADIGTGAGFPGMVVAILREDPITLVEPRARRAAFLRHAAQRLGLGNVQVVEAKAEHTSGTFAVISARAVARLDRLIEWTAHLRDSHTRLIFPRGRNGRAELEELPREWQAVFHVEHSLTDPESVILIASGAP